MDRTVHVGELEKLIAGGKLKEAEELLGRLVMPDTMRVAVLASIEMRRGDLQKAEVLFERVLQADPEHTVASGNLGQLLLGQGKHKRALGLCAKAAIAAPKNEIYALNYAACLAEADRVREAVEVLRPLAAREKPAMRVLLALASLLRADLKAAEALIVLEQVRTLFPDDPAAERALADALAELDPLEARRAFEQAEGRSKNKIAMLWNWSFVELRLENFPRGWELYENGLHDKVGKIGRPLPQVVKGFKQVTELDALDPEKYTLFSCEQGLGDQVLFLGVFGAVLQRFPKSMLIAEERMIPILQRSFPSIPVITYGFAYSLGKQQDRLNGVFPIGSFQRDFRASRDDFLATRSVYLKAHEQRAAKYRALLKKNFGERVIVGISWTGGFWDRQKKTKSIPFEDFATIMGRKEYAFVALQYGDITVEKKYAVERDLPIAFIDGLNFKKDLDGWFALSSVCDRILSVSTALVHFCGAAGKRVDVLMGTAQGPFIWGLQDGPSIAYTDVWTWRRRGDETNEQFMMRMSEALL